MWTEGERELRLDCDAGSVIIWLPSGITDNIKKLLISFVCSVLRFHQGQPETGTERAGGDGRHKLKVFLKKINYGGCIEKQSKRKENERNHRERRRHGG